MQTATVINQDWLYCAQDDERFAAPRASERQFTPVHLPHSNVELPLTYFSEQRTQIVSWYRKHLPTPAEAELVFLDFDGVMMVADVFVNGQLAATQRGGYSGFSVEITPFLRRQPGTDNVIAVRVDARLHDDIPPCGRVMDYQTFGGIYRDVRLRIVPACYLDDLFVHTPDALAEHKTLTAAATVRNRRDAAWHGTARLELLSLDGKVLAAGPATPVTVDPQGEQSIALVLTGLTGIELWELEAPRLYLARVTLLERRRAVDRVQTRCGFREAVFTKEGPFLLNGKPRKLVGLNRHQTYPYLGAAAPARLQWRDAEILKYEIGCNIVRTSHYPQSPHFLDRCDEIGLLVFEEIPGWGHIGDEAWKDLSCRDVEAMIRRDRNHPAIILWGVRINESGDDHDFYTRTNALARALDPSRQTGGVRWGINSEFLEDVFTTNDYGYNPPEHIINEPPVTPYLITEYGSLADTRRTAHCEVLVNAAITHAEVVDAFLGHQKIAGGVGWCAFDYHSQDWITIDGIQPWGVADVFRVPKYPAAVYASQLDPAVRPVLQAVTRWKVGDQAGFDPNEHLIKHGHDAPMVIFSNCDRLDVYVGGEHKATCEPAHDRFPHLAHPPFFCSLGTVWGPAWQELRIVGYLGDTPVIEQRFPATNEAAELALDVDDRTLIADGSDMTRIVLRHTDGCGNLQPYSRAVAQVTVTGPATLVGPNPCALSGGVVGLYLRAGTTPGKVTITAIAPELGQTRQATVTIRAKR